VETPFITANYPPPIRRKAPPFFPALVLLFYPSIVLIRFLYFNPIGGGDIMKKIAIELLIVAVTVAAYVLPVLADGGGW
jgi:hypothetical protein